MMVKNVRKTEQIMKITGIQTEEKMERISCDYMPPINCENKPNNITNN
jgi:hypothetical protein